MHGNKVKFDGSMPTAFIQVRAGHTYLDGIRTGFHVFKPWTSCAQALSSSVLSEAPWQGSHFGLGGMVSRNEGAGSKSGKSLLSCSGLGPVANRLAVDDTGHDFLKK